MCSAWTPTQLSNYWWHPLGFKGGATKGAVGVDGAEAERVQGRVENQWEWWRYPDTGNFLHQSVYDFSSDGFIDTLVEL